MRRAAAVALVFLIVAPAVAHAWTPGTHVLLGEAVIRSLALLPPAIAELLREFPHDFLYGSIAADTSIAKKYAHAEDFFFLGRQYNFPVALEGALKLKEISYVHAEGYPAAEMKHGPIALINEGMPVVFIATRGVQYEKVISNIEEVRARGGKIIAVATEGDAGIRRYSDHVIYVPDTLEPLQPPPLEA